MLSGTMKISGLSGTRENSGSIKVDESRPLSATDDWTTNSGFRFDYENGDSIRQKNWAEFTKRSKIKDW